MANGKKPPQTLQLDEEVPKTLQLDESVPGGEEEQQPEPTEENLPGSTEKLREAVKSGVVKMQQPTRFEQSRPTPVPEGSSWGDTLRDIAAGNPNSRALARIPGEAWEGFKGAAKWAGGLAKDLTALQGRDEEGRDIYGAGGTTGFSAVDPNDLTLHPTNMRTGRIGALTQKYITDPMMEEWNKGEETGGVEGLGHKAAAMVPFFGPMAAQAGELIGGGDAPKTIGQGAGMLAAGELMGKVGPPEVARGMRDVKDYVTRGTPLTEKGRLAEAVNRIMTVKPPGMSEVDYRDQVTKAIPDLQQIAADNKGKVTDPLTGRDALTGWVKKMESPIHNQLARLGDRATIHPDQYVQQVTDAIDQAFAKRPGHFTPEEVEAAKKSVFDFLGTDAKQAAEIEGNRMRMNEDADAYYKAKPADQRGMDKSEANSLAQRAAADKIRELEYDGENGKPGWLEQFGITAVDSAGGPIPLREFRQRVGRVINIRNHMEDAIVRGQLTGDWKPFQSVFKGPSLAAGGIAAAAGTAVGGPIGSVLGLIAGEGLKAWGDYLRTKNPNVNMTEAFRNLERSTPPPAMGAKINPLTRMGGYPEPIGPQPAAIPAQGTPEPGQPFEISGRQQPAANAGLFQHQEPVGTLPPIGFGEPYEERFRPGEPIRGEQQPLNIPPGPEEAPLFSIGAPKFPKEAEAAPVEEPPAKPGPTTAGGPGREGRLGRIGEEERPAAEEPKKKEGALNIGPGEDLGPGLGREHIITDAEGKRLGSVTVEPREPGTLHVNWLGGDLGRGNIRGPLMEEMLKQYPDTEKITYDRRRLAKGAEAATTEVREMKVPQNLRDKVTTQTGMEDLKEGDTFVDDKGEPRRITEIADGKIKTADGTERTYDENVQHLGEINSPRAQLARGGKFIGEFPPETEEGKLGEIGGKEEWEPPAGLEKGIDKSEAVPTQIPLEEKRAAQGGAEDVASPLKSMVSDEQAKATLGRKMKRGEDIGAPKNKALVLEADGKKYYFGPLSTDQFIDRWENQLDPELMQRWRDWYPEVGKRFKQAFGEGAEGARKLMAWLSSQKNTSPAGGMMNVLRTEDIMSGQRRILSGGLAEDQIRAMLQGKTPESGLGAKLHDFVDSALGKKNRTWMGDDEQGGAPAVIDVHSARGNGYFDEALLNAIEKKFGPEAVKGISEDLKGAPSETQYERGSERYNQIAKELNDRNYKGGGWTPDQVQAVDWAAMGKQLGRDMELPDAIFDKNIRRVAYEVKPSPNSPLGKKFNFDNLTHEQGAAITRDVTEHALKIASKEAGGYISNKVFGPGGWQDARGGIHVSPATHADLLASPEAAERVAHLLGHMLGQDEVITARPLKSGNGHAFEIREVDSRMLADPALVHKFWQEFTAEYPKAEGFMPVRKADGSVGIQILKKNGHLSTSDITKLEQAATKASEATGIKSIETEHFPADVKSITNDWEADTKGEGYLERLKEIGKPGIVKRLREEYGPSVEKVMRDAFKKHVPKE